MARKNPGTQYMRLAQALMQQIRRGEFPVGSLLPTEEALCTLHGVSRITVRGAMRELESRGLISRRPRIGTRVEASRPQATFAHVGDSIDGILQFTKDLPFHGLAIERLTVDADLAHDAGLPLGEGFVRVTGVRGQPGEAPVLYSQHLFPALYASQLKALDGRVGSIPEWLAESRGDEIHEIRQRIDATRLSRAAAQALQVRTGTTAVRSRRWYFTRGGDLVVMSTSVSPQGRYVFTSVLRRDPR